MRKFFTLLIALSTWIRKLAISCVVTTSSADSCQPHHKSKDIKQVQYCYVISLAVTTCMCKYNCEVSGATISTLELLNLLSPINVLASY